MENESTLHLQVIIAISKDIGVLYQVIICQQVLCLGRM